jgi:hypothetical protein
MSAHPISFSAFSCTAPPSATASSCDPRQRPSTGMSAETKARHVSISDCRYGNLSIWLALCVIAGMVVVVVAAAVVVVVAVVVAVVAAAAAEGVDGEDEVERQV